MDRLVPRSGGYRNRGLTRPERHNHYTTRKEIFQCPKATRRKRKTDKLEVPKLEALKQINLNAAGLDIGDDEIYVAVPEGRDEVSVRVFQTFTRDLHALADWLETCGVDTVAMESTGVYWIPSYDILEARGFEVYLVNARHIKNVPGKKTDILDCQWIQQLHTYGLLQGSFRPADNICVLRALIRHRDMLIRYRSSHVQHMQKALHMMNVQLTNVLSNITGVTGMKIIRGIVSGNHDPQKLAQYRDYRCGKSKEEIALALEGNYRTEHLFALKQALELYDLYSQKIEDCDAEIETMYSAFEPQVNIIEKPLKDRKRKRNKPVGNEPDFDLRLYLYQMTGVDLTQIDGIGALYLAAQDKCPRCSNHTLRDRSRYVQVGNGQLSLSDAHLDALIPLQIRPNLTARPRTHSDATQLPRPAPLVLSGRRKSWAILAGPRGWRR